jgi:DNA-binding transcriptional regulator LsrR (DeoR family)
VGATPWWRLRFALAKGARLEFAVGVLTMEYDPQEQTETDANPLEVQIAAYLRAKGSSQRQIADAMRIKQSTVSRYLKAATESGLLKERTPFFDRRRIDPERFEEIRKKGGSYWPGMDELTSLIEKYAEPAKHEYYESTRPRSKSHSSRKVAMIKEVRVIESGSTGITSVEYARRIATMMPVAASEFQFYRDRLNLVGVPWGATMAGLVEALRVFQDPSAQNLGPSAREVAFVPLAGETHDHPYLELSSSNLARRLDRLVNEPLRKHKSERRSFQEPGAFQRRATDVVPDLKSRMLGGVPSRIPKSLDAKSGFLKHFLSRNLGYRNVFGDFDSDGNLVGPVPLVKKLDAVFTSVGTFSPDRTDAWHDDTIKAENITSDLLEERTLGDICGIFLARRREHDAWVRDLNSRLTGLREDHIKECAWRARQDSDGPLGVILIALGRAKTEIVAECVRQGWINILIIDDDLANSLLHHIKASSAQRMAK